PQKTPQRGRFSTPSKLLHSLPVESSQAPHTLCRGKDKSPVRLYKPKEYMELASRRSAASGGPRTSSTTLPRGQPRFPSTMEPSTQRRVASATETPTHTRIFGRGPPTFNSSNSTSPRYNGLPRHRTRSSSPTKALALPIGVVSPRRRPCEPDPARPTVQLLRVIYKCWDKESEKDFEWTINDALLRGGCEERECRDIWIDLRCAVKHLWPSLENTATGVEYDYCGITRDPNINEKHSSLERVGFSMSPDAFDCARELVRELVELGCTSERLLVENINPFFMIYAFADSDLPLPHGFSRQLFWKHLDGIVRQQEGLRHDDPEDIVGTLVTIKSTGKVVEPDERPVYELRLVINRDHWAVRSSLGNFWYEAADLDDRNIPCFALLDALTRWLPHWRGGILQVLTSDVCVMWGIRGMCSGAWAVAREICERYDVVLRARFVERMEECAQPYRHQRLDRSPGPLRDLDVVYAVARELMAPGQEHNVPYRNMISHLMA
ncbi:hypothetical protein B0F90DRAFT_1708258, partial [Multifurca ochricompacta]